MSGFGNDIQGQVLFTEIQAALKTFEHHAHFAVDDRLGKIERHQAAQQPPRIEHVGAAEHGGGNIHAGFVARLGVVAVGTAQADIAAGGHIVIVRHLTVGHLQYAGFNRARRIVSGPHVSNR